MNKPLPSPKILIPNTANFHTGFKLSLQRLIYVPLCSIISTFKGIFSKNSAIKMFLFKIFKFVVAIYVPISSG